MKTIYTNVFCLLLSLSFLFVQCSKETVTPKSSAKSLDNPTIDGVTSVSSTYDANASSYTFTVYGGTDITALKVVFGLPAGATATPISGSVQNFTNPVIYTVKAEDGSTKVYTVKLLVLKEIAPSQIYNVILAKGQSTAVTGLTSYTFSPVPSFIMSSTLIVATSAEKSIDGIDAYNIVSSTSYRKVSTYWISELFNRTDGQNRPLAYFYSTTTPAGSTIPNTISCLKVVSVNDKGPEYGFLPMLTVYFVRIVGPGGRVSYEEQVMTDEKLKALLESFCVKDPISGYYRIRQ